MVDNCKSTIYKNSALIFHFLFHLKTEKMKKMVDYWRSTIYQNLAHIFHFSLSFRFLFLNMKIVYVKETNLLSSIWHID